MAAPLWNKAPFIRLFIALAGGIVLQWYLQGPLVVLLICFCACFLFTCFYSFTTVEKRFQLNAFNGICITGLVVATGCILVWLHDVRNHHKWIGNDYKAGDYVVVTMEEPLVEKANSYKALASFRTLYQNNLAKQAEGALIVYFKKDSVVPPLHYGDQIIFNSALQPIKNAGNPGSFDYKTYCLFQTITHQVFLSNENYVVLPTSNKNWFKSFIYQSRSWVVGILKKYIKGEKEQGLSEALLIGYKDDLDKNLVQAYTNTGVVHVIAISGLHLGLIYWLLLLLTKPLKRMKKAKLMRLLLIISSLWLFSILAGGQPSVLRSALMFTVLAFGEVVLRRTNIFNSLAASAFVLLCINPFWLWDVGFQLSYAAVLSILIFFKPISHWFYFSNKAVRFLWNLSAVTIAAQILTMPVSIYHFHQMPLLFLFTNFIAVPLSSGIVIGEIFLCVLSFLPVVAKIAGIVLTKGIYLMNAYIERLNDLPFSIWNFLSISILQTILLVVFITAICYWLMEKERKLAWLALGCFAVFMTIRAYSFFRAYQQRKLIVYNVPKQSAIDVIDGRTYSFIGDSALLYDDFARNFHLQPSRILHRISSVENVLSLKSFQLNGKQILLVDETLPFTTVHPKQAVDLLVLSKNPKLYISQLFNAFSIKQIVIDGSVPAWKAALWKRDCDLLKISCYNVSEDGAFVMNW